MRERKILHPREIYADGKQKKHSTRGNSLNVKQLQAVLLNCQKYLYTKKNLEILLKKITMENVHKIIIVWLTLQLTDNTE